MNEMKDMAISIDLNFDNHILKNLLENSNYFSNVYPHLDKKYFKSLGTKEIYSIIKTQYENSGRIPSLTEVVISVKNIPNPEVKKQIASSLVELSKIQSSSDEFMISETVKYIKDSIFTEGLMIGADGISRNSEDLKTTAWAMMEEAVKFSINSDHGLDFENIESRIEYYGQKLSGLFTGHKDIDERLLTGFLPKTLSIIAAPQGIGKSLMLADFTSSFLKQGKNILFVSMEMSDYETMKRIDANVLDIPIYQLRSAGNSFIKEKFSSLTNLGKLYTKEFSPGCFSATMLENEIKIYKNELGIEFDVIMLDYLGLMKSDRLKSMESSYNYIKSISEEVRAVAVKFNLPIITAAQLNRSSQQNLEAGNESMSESMGIVMTADFIMMLLQTDEYKRLKKMRCKITKNRFSGITDIFELGIDYDYMRFVDLENYLAPTVKIETYKDQSTKSSDNKEDPFDF